MTQPMTDPTYPQLEPTTSAVERIAAFAAAVRPVHLTNDFWRLFKRNILDGLGCAVAVLQGQEHEFSRIPTIRQKSAQVRRQCAV